MKVLSEENTKCSVSVCRVLVLYMLKEPYPNWGFFWPSEETDKESDKESSSEELSDDEVKYLK